MSAPRKPASLPAPVLAEVLREAKIARQSILAFDAETEDLVDGALRPHWPALARTLAPARKNRDGSLTLRVFAHPDYCAKFELPWPSRLEVRFIPSTGQWSSPTAAPWEPGLATLAGHIFHIETGQPVGPFEVKRRLLTLLGLAVLRTYRDGSA